MNKSRTGGRARRCRTTVLAVLTVLICTFGTLPAESWAAQSGEDSQTEPADPVTSLPAYPLKVSANGRYLVDQNNTPFLMVGDAPQTIVSRLSIDQANTFIENRQHYGINTLWINLLSNDDDACNGKAATFDGITPFMTTGDLSTANRAYFRRADQMMDIATANGMVVLLDPIETGCWLDTLRANGAAKAFAYGQFLGERYAKYKNIIWLHGNDLWSWPNTSDDAVVQAVLRGIRSMDAVHLHTVELFARPSLDDESWAPLIQIDAAYTYVPTFVQVSAEYNRSNFKPVIMLEANYEFEHLPGTDGGSVQNLRRQEYWSMLSGAVGHVYGSSYSWRFDNGWQTKLASPGIIELSYMRGLFINRRWYDLVPDTDHSVVTAGYGQVAAYTASILAYLEKFSGTKSLINAPMRKLFFSLRRYTSFGSIVTSDYVAAARIPDGSLVIAYIPSRRTVTVDMSKLAGVARARWYDPTSGRYVEQTGSPFPNSGEMQFNSPGANDKGDEDWALVLEANPRQ
jgi:hypothetical protein